MQLLKQNLLESLGEMKAGDVVFVRGTSLISKIIRFFDKGEFSHVAIAVNETEVIEINWNIKSEIVPFYYKDYEIVRLDLTEYQRDQILPIARSLEGRWYDYLQILGFFFNGKFNDPRKFICSELVYIILSKVRFITDKRIKDYTPNELYQTLKGGGKN